MLPMKLAAYLKHHGLSDEEFASHLGGGLSAEAVRKWRFGVRTPRPVHLVRIAEVTNGDVTANDFLPAPAATPADTKQVAA